MRDESLKKICRIWLCYREFAASAFRLNGLRICSGGDIVVFDKDLLGSGQPLPKNFICDFPGSVS